MPPSLDSAPQRGRRYDTTQRTGRQRLRRPLALLCCMATAVMAVVVAAAAPASAADAVTYGVRPNYRALASNASTESDFLVYGDVQHVFAQDVAAADLLDLGGPWWAPETQRLDGATDDGTGNADGDRVEGEILANVGATPAATTYTYGDATYLFVAYSYRGTDPTSTTPQGLRYGIFDGLTWRLGWVDDTATPSDDRGVAGHGHTPVAATVGGKPAIVYTNTDGTSPQLAISVLDPATKTWKTTSYQAATWASTDYEKQEARYPAVALESSSSGLDVVFELYAEDCRQNCSDADKSNDVLNVTTTVAYATVSASSPYAWSYTSPSSSSSFTRQMAVTTYSCAGVARASAAACDRRQSAAYRVERNGLRKKARLYATWEDSSSGQNGYVHVGRKWDGSSTWSDKTKIARGRQPSLRNVANVFYLAFADSGDLMLSVGSQSSWATVSLDGSPASYSYGTHTGATDATVGATPAVREIWGHVAVAYGQDGGGLREAWHNFAPNVDFDYQTRDYAQYQFRSGASDDNGIAAYAWDFGDGSTSTATNPSHTYAENDTYTVTHTGTDEYWGESGTSTETITACDANNITTWMCDGYINAVTRDWVSRNAYTPVNRDFTDVAYDAANGFYYAVSKSDHSLYRLRPQAEYGEEETIAQRVAGTGFAADGDDDEDYQPSDGTSMGEWDEASGHALNSPSGIAVHPSGRWVYVADTLNNKVKVVDVSLPTPMIRTIVNVYGEAGYGPRPCYTDEDGQTYCYAGDNAQHQRLNQPTDVELLRSTSTACGTAGSLDGIAHAGGCLHDVLVIADRENEVVEWTQLVDPDSPGDAHYYHWSFLTKAAGTADATGNDATHLTDPVDVAATGSPSYELTSSLPNGTVVYVADKALNLVKRWTPEGQLVTAAGSGASGTGVDHYDPLDTDLSQPQGVAVDPSGRFWVSDTGNHRVLRFDPAGFVDEVVSAHQDESSTPTSGSDGNAAPATDALLNLPKGLDVTAGTGGTRLVLADNGNQLVRQVWYEAS